MLKSSGDLPQFLAICYATSYPFGFPYRIKCLPLYILKFIVTRLINQDNKFTLIRVDEYGALVGSSEFMRTCHNRNIIVQNTGGYSSSLNGKSEISNNTLDNITRALLLKSSHKKKIWFFAYQDAIRISYRTDNMLCGDVPYFLWNVSMTISI